MVKIHRFPATEFRQVLARLYNNIRHLKDRFIITKNGKDAAVVISVPEYTKLEKQQQFLDLALKYSMEGDMNKFHDLLTSCIDMKEDGTYDIVRLPPIPVNNMNNIDDIKNAIPEVSVLNNEKTFSYHKETNKWQK